MVKLTARKPKSRRRRDFSDSSDDDEDMGSGDDTSVDDDASTTETEDDDDERKPITPLLANSPVLRLKTLPEEDMLKRLSSFKRLYGHCGVPPGWPRDVVLADWCTAQRQMHREVVVFKYREATEAEDMVIARLNDMEFIWDYFDWHWTDRSTKLEACLSNKANEDPTYAVKNIIDWIQDQSSQVRTGRTDLTPERCKRLQSLGIVL